MLEGRKGRATGDAQGANRNARVFLAATGEFARRFSYLYAPYSRPHRCFCGSTPDPRPPRLATPHSCANPCTRSRPCGHPCSLNCHPGPCPPCQVTTSMPCYCGKHTQSFRCSHLGVNRPGGPAIADLSCGQTCGRMLNCGNHYCQDTCHMGKCGPCSVRDKASCYCGKEERELACGEGEEKECLVATEDGLVQWKGRFACQDACKR